MKCNRSTVFAPRCEKDAVVFDANTDVGVPDSRCCLEHAVEVDERNDAINEGIKNGTSKLKRGFVADWRPISEYPEEGAA